MKVKLIYPILNLVFLLGPILLKAQEWSPITPVPGSSDLIYRTGNVGIGTTTPNQSFKLHVVGRSDFEGILSFKNNTIGYISWGTNDLRLVSKQDYLNLGAANFTNQLVIQGSTGNVGIGTTNPVAKLDVNGAIKFQASGSFDVAAEIRSSDGNTNSMTLRANNLRGEIVAQNNRDFSIKDTQDNILFYGKNGGNVGIGTTTPSEKLEIYDSPTTPGVISLKSSRNDASNVDVGRITIKQNSTEVARIGFPRSNGTYTGYLTFWTKDDNVNLTPSIERMRIDAAGNVGIGTTTPVAKLEIFNANAFNSDETSQGQDHILFSTNDPGIGGYFGGITWKSGSRRRASIAATREHADADFVGLAFFTQGVDGAGPTYESMRIAHNGNVGIGTTAPLTKLHVIGSSQVEHANGTSIILDGYGGISSSGPSHWLHINRYSNDNVSIGSNSTTSVFLVNGGGNVGIGTTDPGTYKLAVEGQIGARSVKVTQAPWADYVFAPSYELMPLEEVENYIQQNQHLPNVASAKEIEENGFVLEAMDAKLMEKIEELTLYMIEQQKEINALKKEMKRIKRNINE